MNQIKDQNCLVVSIGNRDIAIAKKNYESLPEKEKGYFTKNNDEKEHYVIAKNDKLGSFLDISKRIYESEVLVKLMIAPLIEKIMQEKKKIYSMVYLLPTKQPTMDKQDTYYVAEIVKSILVKKYSRSRVQQVEIKPIQYQPTNLEDLTSFFSNFFEEINTNSCDNVYVGCSGGTPQMRTAMYMAGLFKKYHYWDITSRPFLIKSTNFDFLEKKITSHKIKAMLTTYDFSGVATLNVDDQITKKAKDALDFYNLAKDTCHNSSYQEKLKFKIGLLMANLQVCIKQKRWAETIGRIMTLEEQIWQYMVYLILQKQGFIYDTGKGLINYYSKSNKGKTISEFCKYKLEKWFENEFAGILVENNGGDIIYRIKGLEKHPSFISIKDGGKGNLFEWGKNTYYFIIKGLAENNHEFYSSDWDGIIKFFEKLNLPNNQEQGKSFSYDRDKSKLNSLRNKSLVGHGTKGVDREKIEAITEDIHEFFKEFSSHLKDCFNIETLDIFEKIKEEIIGILEEKEA